jgi:DNA-binding PadR family transcriptional regulator
MANELTELEGCVLGLVWESKRMTPYAIRRVFQESPSPHWSGSAGAIYPLVRRLQNGGLLRSREDYTGQRRRELYEVTAKGVRALRRWIGPALVETFAAIPVDPLRLRVRFLGVLNSSQRADLLRRTERELRDQVKEAERGCREHDPDADAFSYLLARGVLRASRARLAWIREAIHLLEAEPTAARRGDRA